MFKKFLAFFLAAMLCVPVCALVACGNDEPNSAPTGDLDGMYYGVGLYRADEDEQVGYIKISGGVCSLSLDSRATYSSYTIDGHYLEISPNADSKDAGRGIAAVINNGVIYTVVDSVITVFCKQGKKPEDAFVGISGLSGKYLLYMDNSYRYSVPLIIFGDLFIMQNNLVGKVECSGSDVIMTPTKNNRGGAVPAEPNTFKMISENALEYTDREAGTTTYYCKVGYDETGNKNEDEYIAAIDANGGYFKSGYPSVACTVDGKLHIGIYSDEQKSEMDYPPYYDVNTFSAFYPHKRHCEFLGYNTEKDGSGVDFYDGMELTSDITLYAQWEEVE